MKNDNWCWVVAVTSSQRHNEILDVLYHTTDDDMVLCKHGVFHSFVCDVFFTDWLFGDLANVQPFVINVLDACTIIILSLHLVEVSSNDLSFL